MNGTMPRFSLKYTWAAVALVLAMLCCAVGCSSESPREEASQEGSAQEAVQQDKPKAKKTGMDFEYTNKDLDPSYDESQAVFIDLTGEEAFAQDERVQVDGTVVTIVDEGVYLVSGMLSNGQIVVDAPQDADVQLVLSNAAIHNEAGPAIYAKQAGTCFVTLAERSENSLTDAAEYVPEEQSENPCATLYAACNLTLNGSGSLSVNSACHQAVYSEKSLVVTGGTHVATAAQDGLVGEECVKVCGGSLTVDARLDAVKSTSEKAYQGFVSLDGGSFFLKAGDDAIQAFRLLRVMDGSVNAEAGDDALHADRKVLLGGGSLSLKASDDAVHAGTVLTMDDGSVDVASCFEGYEAEQIYINGGSVNITSTADAMNAASSKANKRVQEDSQESEKADQADDQAEEGEAEQSPAEPEGVQAATGPEEESFNESAAFGKPETGMAEGGVGMGDQNCIIRIADGMVVLNAGGDGLDTNGNLVISGGTVLISGPGTGGNAPIDYDISAKINGGTVIATGMEGMAQNFTGGKQPFAFVKASGQAGSNVALVGSDGQVLASLTPLSSFNVVMVSSPSFQEDEAYSLVVGGIVEHPSDGEEGAASTVSGGNAVEFTASTTPKGGMGGLESNGFGAPAGQAGDKQIPKRK